MKGDVVNYYTRSGIVGRALGLGALLAWAAGCTSASSMAAEAPRVRVVELAGSEANKAEALSRLPVVLVFEAGDEVPFELVLDSRLLTLEQPAEPMRLVASRRFFVLLRPEGAPRISEDGEDFDTQPKSSFGFSLSATKGGGSKARLVIGLRPGP